MPGSPIIVAMALGCVAAIVALVLCARRLRGVPAGQRRTLIALRTLLLALLLGAVLNPTLPITQPQLQLPPIAVAIDRSASMTQLPMAGQKRYQQALDALQSGPLADALESARVLHYAVGDHARPIPEPLRQPESAEKTDLPAALSEILRSPRPEPLRACLLVSDGADGSGLPAGVAGQALAACGVPIYCLGVGSADPLADVSIPGLVYPREVVEGDPIEVRVLLAAPGFEGEALRLTLTEEGGETVEREIPAGETERSERVTLTAGAPGWHRYRLAAQELSGEVTLANNSRALLVHVQPREARLLVIEGRPRREYAFLRRLLLRVEDIETTLVLRKSRPAGFWLDMGTPRKVAGPSAAIDLDRARAVILSNVPADAIGADYAGRLASFVRGGGSLAMIGGEGSFGAGGWSGTAVGEILPVRLASDGAMLSTAARARLSDGGQLSRALADSGVQGWERMPLLQEMNAVAGATAGAEVAMQALSGDIALGPMLAAGRAGAGRVLALTVADTHRWMQSPNASDASRVAYEALWRTIIGWLLAPRADEQVVLELDRDTYETGAVIRARVHVQDDAGEPVDGARVNLRVQRGEAVDEKLAEPGGSPGLYRVFVNADEAGPWRLTATAEAAEGALGEDSRSVQIVEGHAELAEGRARPEVLREIAQATGGDAFSLAKVADLASALPLQPDESATTDGLHPARTAWFFGLVLLVAGADWLLRRRWSVG